MEDYSVLLKLQVPTLAPGPFGFWGHPAVSAWRKCQMTAKTGFFVTWYVLLLALGICCSARPSLMLYSPSSTHRSEKSCTLRFSRISIIIFSLTVGHTERSGCNIRSFSSLLSSYHSTRTANELLPLHNLECPAIIWHGPMVTY